MKWRATRWLLPFCVFAGAILISSASFAQISTPSGKYAGTAGASCAGLGQQYAWPDANGQVLQCVSNVWTVVSPSSVSSGVYLGISASITNPARSSGELTTGLFSAGSGLVDVSSLGTQVGEFSSTGLNLGTSVATTGALKLGGVNGISFPTTDSTFGGSIAIGPSALSQEPSLASTAFGNIAIGYQSMSSASMTTAAVNNVAVGYQALQKNTTGSESTAMGYLAMNANTTGGGTAFGAYDLLLNTTGQGNVAVGWKTMLQNTTGGANTAVGDQALSNNSTGYDNTAVGMRANTNVTTGVQNTAVGRNAAYQITSGTNNSVFGYSVAGTTLNTGSNNILIGTSNAVDTPLPGTSNFLNIGNTIFATGMTGTLSSPAGNVGIGTTPGWSTKLQVAGMGLFTSGTYNPVDGTPAGVEVGYNTGSDYGFIQSVYTGVAWKTLVLQPGGGTVGIGTTAPFATFQVREAANENVTFIANDNGTYSGASGIQSINDAYTNYEPFGFYASQFYFGGGNVGIGTTAPDAQLTVGAALGSNLTPIAEFNTASSKPLLAGIANSGGVMIGYSGNDIQGRTGSALSTNGNLVLNDYGGNVGIGTTNPDKELTVYGSSNSSYLHTVTTGNNDTGVWITGPNNADWTLYTDYTGHGGYVDNFSIYKNSGTTGIKLTIQDNGNVGIGTTTPANRLDVYGGEAIGSYAGTVAPTNGLLVSGMVGIGTATTVNDLDVYGSVAFGSYAGQAAPSGGMIVSGNVGIGTAAPDAILSLGGQSAQTIDMVRETTAATPGNNLTIKAGGATAGGTNLAGGNLILASGVSTGAASSDILLQTYNWDGASGTADNTPNTVVHIDGRGNVSFQGAGGAAGNQITFNMNNNSLDLGSGLLPDEGWFAINRSNSNMLWINAGGGGVVIGPTTNGGSSKLFATWDTAASDISSVTEIIDGKDNTSSNFAAKFRAKTGSGTTSDLMVIRDDGNVGIGTTAPQATLDVNGYARLALQSSAPVTCSTTNKGSIALNHLAQMCACNGTSWIFADSVGGACSW